VISASGQQTDDNTNPEMVARKITNRIIQDTYFQLADVLQKPALDLQVIDFSKSDSENKIVYAFSTLFSEKSQNVLFGISYSEPFELYVNNQLVLSNSIQAQFTFKEIAYEIFVFQDTIRLELRSGRNEIYFKSISGKWSFIYLRELTGIGEGLKTKFQPVDTSETNFVWPWCYSKSFEISSTDNGYLTKEYLTNNEISDIFSNASASRVKYYASPVLKKFASKEGRIFKKDSYVEWQYSHGTMMMSILYLAEVLNEYEYIKFVEDYCDYNLETLPVFKTQYYEQHDLQTENYRIFRKSMLDDTGAPILPFISLELINHDEEYSLLIKKIAEYVSLEQFRLEDGTFCRPEPFVMSVWADDLFMSVPFLVRLGKLTGDEKYFNDAAIQIINFNKYLSDTSNGLYKHCWYNDSKKQSAVNWGRANGWIIWATSEALLTIPFNHQSYKQILDIYKKHIDAIVSYQNENGMWHQILNDSTTFEETSCTAMFIIGLSRGLRNGWLDQLYSKNLYRAWDGLTKNIDDGIVKNITRGTGVSDDKIYYASRERFDNDPRGLGAVIGACTEIIITNSQDKKQIR
jgi:unsaturated rhamnogalacturonyl hydrolase